MLGLLADAAFWLGLADRYGLPLVALVCVGLAVVVFARWASKQWEWGKSKVVLPALNRHIEFVGNVERLMDQNTSSLLKLTELSNSHKESLEQHGQELRQHGQHIEQLAQAMRGKVHS